MAEQGKVQIHGKTYLTVAYRTNAFRNSRTVDEGWGIQTEVLSVTVDHVLIKASVVNPAGVVVGTGHSFESWSDGKINSTSAVENAETSAIGRALAACGLGGEEYASANEVQTAIAQQKAGHSNRPAAQSRGVAPQAEPAVQPTSVPEAPATTEAASSIPATAVGWSEEAWVEYLATFDDGVVLVSTFAAVADDENLRKDVAVYALICKAFAERGRKLIDKRRKEWKQFVQLLTDAKAYIGARSA